MARQSRWANFADAFNSVYGVTTQIGRDFATAKVLNKDDWVDEEGNSLTGDALQRAKYDALATIEERFGTPREALAIRTGFEDYNTKSLNNSLLRDTYDDRVYQQGAGATKLLNSRISLNSANAGLAGARTVGQRLTNDFNRATFDGRVDATNSENLASTNKNKGLAQAYADPSYAASLVAGQNLATAEADLGTQQANQTRAAQAQPAFVDAYNDQTVKAAQKSALEAETGLRNAMTDLDLAQTREFQKNRYDTAMAESRGGLAVAQSEQLAAQRRLEANQFLTDWAQTADQNDPESMPKLIQGIKAIDPETGMRMEKEYGEHELWQITNDAVRYKAEANQILSQGGLPALRKWIDDSNGNDNVVLQGDPNGGPVRLLETDPEGNVIRVIAEGADQKTFMENLQGYLDPANMLAISESQYNNQLKAAQAEYARAQANAKGTLSIDEFIAGRLSQNPQDPLALALAFRTNPEAFAQYQEQLQLQGLIDAANSNSGSVPNPLGGAAPDVPDTQLADPVDAPTPTTNPAEAANSVLDSFNAATENMSLEDRASFIAQNKGLLEKYNLYQPEMAKLAVAENMSDALKRQSATEFLEELASFASSEPATGLSSRSGSQSRTRAQQQLEAIRGNPEVLQIVLNDIQNRLATAQQRAGSRGYTGRNAARDVETYQQRIQELEAIIQQLQQN